MYSPAAWPPCQANTAPVNASPMLIHTADSMAASFVVGACGVRWTSSRSTINRTEISARNANQIQMGTSKLAKFSRLPDDWDARTARGTAVSGWWADVQPKVSPATWAVVTGHEAVLTMTHVEGYSPSVCGSLPAAAGYPEPEALVLSACRMLPHQRSPGRRRDGPPGPGRASMTHSRVRPAGRRR